MINSSSGTAHPIVVINSLSKDVTTACNTLKENYHNGIQELESIIAKYEKSTSDALSDDLFDARCLRASLACLIEDGNKYMSQHFSKTVGEQCVKNYLEATVSISQGTHIQTAIVKLQRVLRLDPHFVSAHIGLAAAYYMQGKCIESFKEFSEVLQRGATITPNIVRVGLALCSIKQKKFDHAKLCLERALVLNPNDELAVMALIVVELQGRNLTKTLTLIKKLKELAPERAIANSKFADLLYFKFLASGRLGDPAVLNTIRSFIDTIIQRYEPATAASLSTITAASTTMITTTGNKEEFRSIKDKGVVIATRVPSSLSSLSHSATKSQEKLNQMILAYSYFQKGRLCHFEGKLDEAKQCYRRAIEGVPYEARLAPTIYLVKVLFQQNLEAECERELAALNPGSGSSVIDPEIPKMLCVRHIIHENYVRGLYYAGRLATEAAVADPEAWKLYGFANRQDCKHLLDVYDIANSIAKEQGTPVDWQTRTTIAAVQGKTDELVKIFTEITGISKPNEALDSNNVMRTISATPNNLPLVYNIALCYLYPAPKKVLVNPAELDEPSLNKTDLVTAQRLLVYIVKCYPLFMDAYYQLAQLYFKLHHWSAGLKWLALALHISKNDGVALSMVSKLYYENQNLQFAIDILRRGGGNIVTALSLGSLCLHLAQQPSGGAPAHLMNAKECYNRVLRHDNGNVLAAHGLACCIGLGGRYVSQNARKDPENCLSYVNSVNMSEPTAKEHVFSNLVNLLIRTSSFKRAIEILVDKEKIPRRTVEQTSALAYCYAHEGEFDKALSTLREALEASSENPILKYNEILLMYAAITAELDKKRSMSKEEGKNILTRLFLAVQRSKDFVQGIDNKTSMTANAFKKARENVRKIAKTEQKFEDAVQVAVKHGHLDQRKRGRKNAQWRNRYEEAKEKQARAAAEREAVLRGEEELRKRRSAERYTGLLKRFHEQQEGIGDVEYNEDNNNNNQEEEDDREEGDGNAKTVLEIGKGEEAQEAKSVSIDAVNSPNEMDVLDAAEEVARQVLREDEGRTKK